MVQYTELLFADFLGCLGAVYVKEGFFPPSFVPPPGPKIDAKPDPLEMYNNKHVTTPPFH